MCHSLAEELVTAAQAVEAAKTTQRELSALLERFEQAGSLLQLTPNLACKSLHVFSMRAIC